MLAEFSTLLSTGFLPSDERFTCGLLITKLFSTSFLKIINKVIDIFSTGGVYCGCNEETRSQEEQKMTTQNINETTAQVAETATKRTALGYIKSKARWAWSYIRRPLRAVIDAIGVIVCLPIVLVTDCGTIGKVIAFVAALLIATNVFYDECQFIAQAIGVAIAIPIAIVMTIPFIISGIFMWAFGKLKKL